MTLDEFAKLFRARKLMVHINDQPEKSDALRLVYTYMCTEKGYDAPFDEEFQYIGFNRAKNDICCWHNPADVNANIIEYEELCDIVYGRDDHLDEKSILSLI